MSHNPAYWPSQHGYNPVRRTPAFNNNMQDQSQALRIAPFAPSQAHGSTPLPSALPQTISWDYGFPVQQSSQPQAAPQQSSYDFNAYSQTMRPGAYLHVPAYNDAYFVPQQASFYTPLAPSSAPALGQADTLREQDLEFDVTDNTAAGYSISSRSTSQEIAGSTPEPTSFSSFEEAREYRQRIRHQVTDRNVPADVDARPEVYVQHLARAMRDTENALDGPRVTSAGGHVRASAAYRSFAGTEIPEAELQAACWALLEAMVDLHRRGCTLQEVHHFPAPSRGVPNDVDLSFADRFNAVTTLLKTFKLACKDVIYGDSTRVLAAVRAPRALLQLKQSYQGANDARKNSTPAKRREPLDDDASAAPASVPRKRKRTSRALSSSAPGVLLAPARYAPAVPAANAIPAGGSLSGISRYPQRGATRVQYREMGSADLEELEQLAEG